MRNRALNMLIEAPESQLASNLLFVALFILCLCQIKPSDWKNGGRYIAIRTGKSWDKT